MDFDLGNIFYFIVLIIAAISGIFGKKKKRPGQSPAGQKPASKGFLAKLEEQLEGLVDGAKNSANSFKEEFLPETEEDQGVAPEEASVYESILDQYSSRVTDAEPSLLSKYEGKYVSDYQDNLDASHNEEIKSTSQDEILQVYNMDETDGPDYFEIIENFDLGTAVVYSTILNRQEY